MVRRMGNAELDREGREEFVCDVDEAERDQEQGADLGHEVRHREEVERLEDAQTNQYVHDEDAGNVGASDFQDARTEVTDAEEEGDGEEQNREGAWVDAVNQARNHHEREEPRAAPAHVPERGCAEIPELEECHRGSDEDADRDEHDESFVHIRNGEDTALRKGTRYGVTSAVTPSSSGWPALCSMMTARWILPTPAGPWAAGSKITSTVASSFGFTDSLIPEVRPWPGIP